MAFAQRRHLDRPDIQPYRRSWETCLRHSAFQSARAWTATHSQVERNGGCCQRVRFHVLPELATVQSGFRRVSRPTSSRKIDDALANSQRPMRRCRRTCERALFVNEEFRAILKRRGWPAQFTPITPVPSGWSECGWRALSIIAMAVSPRSKLWNRMPATW